MIVRGLFLSLAVMAAFLTGCAGPTASPSDPDERGASRAPTILESPRVREVGRRGWVEVEAEVIASDEESPAAARRRAIERARTAAVEHVAGVSVKSSVVTLDHVTNGQATDLLQALTATQARALIVDEKLLEHEAKLARSGGFRVRVKLAARVLRNERGRSDFDTEVRLNGNRFRVGERVELFVRVSEDARVYVLSVNDEGAAVLLPNRHMSDTRTTENQWLEFPGELLTRRGVALRAMLSGDRVESREALIVVALRGGRRLENLFPASGEIFRTAGSGETMALASEFLAPLLSIPAEDWTFDQVVYSITRD